MKSVFVGVDLGTSVVKATALEPASGNRYQVSERYASRFEQSQPLGWSLVLERILARLVATLSSGIRVEALAITAMVPNVALINPDGETLGSLLFCDNDAYDLELDLDAELNSPKWSNEVLSKILHIKELSPGKPFEWFTTHNWLVHDLTGAFVVDPVTAGECGNLVNQAGAWNTETMNHFNLPAECLPEIVAATKIVGSIRSNYPVHEFCGVPLAAGTSDTVATAIGAGWRDDHNSLLVYYGTFNCAAQIRPNRAEVLLGTRAENPFHWLLSVPKAGMQLTQIANLVGEGESLSDRLRSLDTLAGTSRPGSNGLVFLHSDDITKTTVSSAPKGSLRHLEPRHTRADLSRAVLEGFAFLLRWSLEKRQAKPESFPKVLAAGGGAQSTLWRQIVSDVCGVSQNYRPAADRGLGSALLAVAAHSPMLLSGIEETVSRETLMTLPSMTTEYERAYQHYLETGSLV